MLLAGKSQCFFDYRNFSRTYMYFNIKNVQYSRHSAKIIEGVHTDNMHN